MKKKRSFVRNDVRSVKLQKKSSGFYMNSFSRITVCVTKNQINECKRLISSRFALKKIKFELWLKSLIHLQSDSDGISNIKQQMFSSRLQSIPDFRFICFEKYLKMISFILFLRRLHLFLPMLQRSFCKMPNKSIYLSKLLLSLKVVACGNHKKYICIFSKGTRKKYTNIKKPSAIFILFRRKLIKE